ncbi:hypothetical protein RUM43_006256 [Polyplax serrata]|uniref:Nose resistant-to-fluoxetine protein N-terminal domain-containing protein n=1 Tax=Polyplax serrata TaxID=468196 RepID=A0AAN8NXJ9_POLSC
MKITFLHLPIKASITYRFLFCFILLVANVNSVVGKSDLRTKLLLQNIRTHLAQKVEEALQKKECESGFILCQETSIKSDEEDARSIEDLGPTKLVRTHQKQSFKVHVKDEVQSKLSKVQKRVPKKSYKEDIPLKPVRPPKLPKVEIIEKKKDDKKVENPGSEGSKFGKQILQKQILKKFEEPKGEIPSNFVLSGKQKKNEKVEKQETKKEKRVEDKKKMQTLQRQQQKPKEKELKKTEEKRVKKLQKLKRTEKEDRKVSKTESPVREAKVFPSGAYFFSMESGNVNGDMCKKHINIYKKQRNKYKMWALMMFDASAKLPSGVLQGNINQYGDFDECLSINAVFKKPDPKGDSLGIRGKYCLANVDLYTELQNDTLYRVLERIKSFSFVSSTVDDPSHFIPRFSSINWGLCVPDTCPAEDVEKLIRFQLSEISETTNVLMNVSVLENNCVVKDNLKFELNGTVLGVLVFYMTVLAAAIYATYLDMSRNGIQQQPELNTLEKQLEEACKDLNEVEDPMPKTTAVQPSEKGVLNRLLMAFSLKTNITRLTEDDGNDTIGCINGIKAIFSIMLYLAHKTIPLGFSSFSNRVFLTKVSNEPASVLLRTSIIYTDSFLLISGLLTAYNLSKEISTNGKINWGKRLLARYIRLTPSLLAVLLFYAYVWDHLGSGPLWNTLVKQNAILCQNYMWRNLLYLQNYFAFENMCAPQTHQLALDMQLSAMAPIFVYLLHKYDKTGLGILQAIFMLSSIVRYTATANNELSVVVYHGITVSQLYKTADKLYAQTLHRSSPYLMGVIVGHYLQRLKGKISLSKPLAVIGWITALLLGFYSLVYPSNMASRSYEYNVTEASQYAALSSVSWSFTLAWLITVCHLGFGGKLNKLLCNKELLIFSRISYAFYLTQFLVFFYRVGVKRIPEVFSFSGSLNTIEFVIVVIISIVVTLLFDIPMVEIKKIVLDTNSPKREMTSKEAESTNKQGEEEDNYKDDKKAVLQDDVKKELERGMEEDNEDVVEAIDEIMEPDIEEEVEKDLEELEGAAEEDLEEITDESKEHNYGADSDEADAEETDDGDEIFVVRPLRRSFNINFDEQEDWLGKMSE